MTELTVSTVRFGFVGLYVMTVLGMGVLTARAPRQVRQYAAILTGVIALSPVVLVFQEFGIGEIAVAGGTIDIATLGQGIVTNVVIYMLVLGLVDASRRLTAVTVAVALVPTFASALVGLLGDSVGSVLGIVYLLGVSVPFPVVLYLFLRPIWQSSESVSRRRRLVHWKARNILLFSYGMLLVYTPMVIAGLVRDPVLNTMILQYSTYLLYGGVAIYLLYNLSRLRPGGEANVLTWSG